MGLLYLYLALPGSYLQSLWAATLQHVLGGSVELVLSVRQTRRQEVVADSCQEKIIICLFLRQKLTENLDYYITVSSVNVIG